MKATAITDEAKAQVRAILADAASNLKFTVTGRKRKWLRVWAIVGKPHETMRLTGISYSTHYWWLKNDPDYAEDYAMVEAMREAHLDSCVYERACEKDTLAAMFWLKSRNRDRYGDKQHVTTDTQVSINVDDKRAQLAALLEQNPQLRKMISAELAKRQPVVVADASALALTADRVEENGSDAAVDGGL